MSSTPNGLWGGPPWGGAAPSVAPVQASGLIYTALRLAGILKAARRGPASCDQSEALDVLNSLVDSLNTNGLNIYTANIAQWPTVASQQSYTIGKDPSGATTANWDGPRPMSKGGRMAGVANLLLPTSPTVRRPIDILDDEEWAAIRLQQIYTYPKALYCDGAYPFSRIYFKPIPDGIYQIELLTWSLLAGFPGLSDSVLLPPGYQRMLEYNLAVELARRNGRARPSPDLVIEARRTRASIQEMNCASPKTTTAELPSQRTGKRDHFDWMSGMAT